MYIIKCAMCDKILGEASVEDNSMICGEHSQEDINEFVCPTTWDTIRAIRDQLLLDSDWTQLDDSPLTPEEKNYWANYRQALRDLPETFENPKDVIFPTIGDFYGL